MFSKNFIDEKIKHFFEYLDYDKFKDDDIAFNQPHKNNNGIFVADLNRPFKFYLPKSELCDMYQDNFSNNIINYMINLDQHSEIIQFLENLDTLCIINASNNSVEWFGKKIDSDKLINYYNTLYELSEDEKTLYLPISIDTPDIPDIIKYNEDDNTVISINISGIEFFQQTFRWKVTFNSIVYASDDSDEDDDDDDVNFDELVSNGITIHDSLSNHVTEDDHEPNHINKDYSDNSHDKHYEYIEKSIGNQISPVKYSGHDITAPMSPSDVKIDSNPPRQLKYALDLSSVISNYSARKLDKGVNKLSDNNGEPDLEESLTKDPGHSFGHTQENESSGDIEDPQEKLDIEENINLNRSIINDLASEGGVTSEPVTSEPVTSEPVITDLCNKKTNLGNLSKDTIQEIESIISEKKLSAKKYIINATRAKRAHDTLSHKADEVTREIELYENKLRAYHPN